ncbi:hypothetical protein SAMN05880558_10543 [Aeromonas sp. RU39B]|nr:hypothetical protein SAMN05880558_10543 [Aeromonas sp. RU39B]
MKLQSNDSPDRRAIGLEFERLAEMLACLDMDRVTRAEVDSQVQKMRDLLN